MSRNLLLFDVDGVLVQPTGYKLALRDTVNYFAQRLGFAPINLSMADIGVFEACGLTNEWDSAAMCVGAMLSTVARTHPGSLSNWHTWLNSSNTDTLLQQIQNTTAQDTPHIAPDFRAIAQTIKSTNPDDNPVTAYTHALLRDSFKRPHRPVLDRLFMDIYSVNTPTTRVQQTFTLGHRRFEQTYGLPAPFESESYLLQHDQPLLSAEKREQLLVWRQAKDHGFTIYTARPSLPPEGTPLGYAPEADLARDLLGFPTDVPLVAAGRMQWVAAQHQRTVAAYIKPSPVQALAAIGAAIYGDELTSLQAAATLHETGRLTAPLDELQGQSIHATVFEDSTGGIVAVKRAVDLLKRVGISINLRAIGVSDEASKQAALRQVADRVVPDINTALVEIL